MRILLIGGNGFIGSTLMNELRRSGHHLAILHRRADADSIGAEVVWIPGDRNRLSDYRNELRRFSPDVIIDLILSSGEQARQLMNISHELTRRVVAISSMDVYRAWGVLHGVEPGSLEALPLTEDSPLRTVRRLYPPETVKMLQNVFAWLDEHYDKIAVEEAIMNDPAIPGTVVRHASAAYAVAFGIGVFPLKDSFETVRDLAKKRLGVLSTIPVFEGSTLDKLQGLTEDVIERLGGRRHH